MEDTKRAARRRHDPELKSLVLEQCEQPGASVARIALTDLIADPSGILAMPLEL